MRKKTGINYNVSFSGNEVRKRVKTQTRAQNYCQTFLKKYLIASESSLQSNCLDID